VGPTGKSNSDREQTIYVKGSVVQLSQQGLLCHQRPKLSTRDMASGDSVYMAVQDKARGP
jgi:predicted RecA/RadA family phage recombinase